MAFTWTKILVCFNNNVLKKNNNEMFQSAFILETLKLFKSSKTRVLLPLKDLRYNKHISRWTTMMPMCYLNLNGISSTETNAFSNIVIISRVDDC